MRKMSLLNFASDWRAGKVVVWLLCFCICLDVLARVCLTSPPKGHLRTDKFQNFFESKRNPRIFVLGSSVAVCSHYYSDLSLPGGTMQAKGKDEYEYAKYMEQAIKKRTGAAPDSINLAYSGSMVSDGWLVAQKSVDFGKLPDVIIYEMVSRDFFDASMPELGRTPVFNKIAGLHPSTDNQMLPKPVIALMDWAINTPLATSISIMLSDTRFLTDPQKFQSSIDSISAALCYSYKARSNTRKWLTDKTSELLARKSSLYESIRQSQEQRKKLDPFAPLVSAKTGTIEVDAKPQMKRFDDELVYFEKLLKLCQKTGISLIAVNMPVGEIYAAKVPPALRDRYPREIKTLCLRYGATYLNCNCPEIFASKDFIDFIHLNSCGAVKLNDLIADEVSKRSMVSASPGKPAHN